jgi:hypothetical protein
LVFFAEENDFFEKKDFFVEKNVPGLQNYVSLVAKNALRGAACPAYPPLRGCKSSVYNCIAKLKARFKWERTVVLPRSHLDCRDLFLSRECRPPIR